MTLVWRWLISWCLSLSSQYCWVTLMTLHPHVHLYWGHPALHSVSHNQPVKCWYFLPSGSESRRKVSSSQFSQPPTLPPLICKYIWWRLGSQNSRYTGNILVKYLVWSVFELLITGRWECLESGTTSLTVRRELPDATFLCWSSRLHFSIKEIDTLSSASHVMFGLQLF